MGKWLEKLDDWTNRHRPTALLGVVSLTVGIVAFLSWSTGSDLFQQLFDPKRESVADVRFWSALVYGLAFAMGLPVAFLLWHWRDRNVRDQIEETQKQTEETRKQVENQRKDINLKEFQEVQLRAAGALSGDLPKAARDQLQIAALRQLTGFMRGEYGDAFRRPAFELLLSGHAESMREIGTYKLKENCESAAKAEWSYQGIQEAVAELRSKIDAVAQERIWIIKDEWETIRSSSFPLDHRNFDLVDLQGKDVSDLTLYHSSFIGARLGGSSFKDSKLWSVNAHGANFVGCTLGGARAMSSKFHGADFGMAAFGTCQLMGSKLVNSNLASSTFFGSHLDDLTLENCILDGVRLEEGENGTVNTQFLAGLTTIFLPYANEPDSLKELSPSQFKKLFKQKLNELPDPSKLDSSKLEALKERFRQRGAICDGS